MDQTLGKVCIMTKRRKPPCGGSQSHGGDRLPVTGACGGSGSERGASGVSATCLGAELGKGESYELGSEPGPGVRDASRLCPRVPQSPSF